MTRGKYEQDDAGDPPGTFFSRSSPTIPPNPWVKVSLSGWKLPPQNPEGNTKIDKEKLAYFKYIMLPFPGILNW